MPTSVSSRPRERCSRRCVLDLRPRPPFRLDLTVRALRRRPHDAIDTWDGHSYRTLLDGCPRQRLRLPGGEARPEEIAALTLAIVGWNRFAVGVRRPVGGYVSPPQRSAQAAEGR